MLDMAYYEACCHKFTSQLHTLNQVKELLHLLHVDTSWSLRPASLVLQDMVDIAADAWVVLFHVEPLGIHPFREVFSGMLI